MSSSVIFQPLLHDPLGWKPSNSTYVDHYKWKKYRASIKDKKISTYGQQYQRQLQKKQLSQSLPLTTNIEQPISRVIFVKKNEDQQPPTPTPISYRYSPSKTPVYIFEYKQRPASAAIENTTNSDSKASQRPPTAPATIQGKEEKPRPLTALDARQTPKEEKPSVDANNDNTRHWLTYPNPRTPQYILDIKQRLGQLKISSTLARPSSASTQKQAPQLDARPSSAAVQGQRQKQSDDHHNFLTYQTRETPEELRATRYRIDKHRYNPSLDSYPPRPQTCPARPNETIKPGTPEESGTEQPFTTSSKNEAWVVDEGRKSTIPDQESSSILIQVVDCDGLPNEYVDAVETANLAQEEYQQRFKMYGERKPDNFVYRLPENNNDSYIAYQNQQTSNEMNNQLRHVARSAQNDFGVWVRNATDKERASAMKLLQDVLNQPVVGYDNQSRAKSVFKRPPAPTPVRATSATRKLGRTRSRHQFPCEICEKLMIKRHVWDLSGPETVTCPHHLQGIQVRS